MAHDDNDGNGPVKGPWGSRGSKKGPSRPQNQWGGGQPNIDPELEAVLRQAQEKFGRIFNNKPSQHDGKKGLGLVFLVLIALWFGTGFYRVQPGENVVILTFGKWTSTRGEAGLGYHIPWPVQSVNKVNVAFERRLEIGLRDAPRGMSDREAATSQMLTGDENIVNINFVVMWKISDAKNYLFRIRDPETTVRRVAESAMREIIGRSPIQKALSEGRADIESKTKVLMQQILDEYQSGIVINNVQLQNVNPPGPVVDAFDDVQRARADMERVKNEAETYSNDIVPRASGDAKKIIQDAQAYKEAVISKAKGEAARFTSVYGAYAESRDVTEKRLYVETMEQLMRGSKKVLLSDGKDGTGAVLPYLMQTPPMPRQPMPQASNAPSAPAVQ